MKGAVKPIKTLQSFTVLFLCADSSFVAFVLSQLSKEKG